MAYEITKELLPTGTKRRPGLRLGTVKFLVAHDTGNPDSTAKGNSHYYANSLNIAASAHYFVDEHDIIQCIPENEVAYHVIYNVTTDNQIYGYDANSNAIGVELCYSPSGKFSSLESYKKYVWLLASLCVKYKLDPRTKIVGHSKLDPKRKTDPENALKTINKTFSDLIADVYAEYLKQKGVAAPAKSTEKPASTPTPTSSKVKFPLPTGVLNVGSKGTAVKQLQEALNAVYFKCGVDGIYGADTKDAVLRFQKMYGVKPYDGIYGEATRKVLDEKVN